MYEIQIQSYIFPAIISIFLLWFIRKTFHKRGGNKNPPPSPPKLPILGNLHQLGSLPHRNLQSLARKHGPLMLLHFGSVPVLIVSSADTACEIMRNHDVSFSERPLYKVIKKVVHGGKDVAFAPYGDYWRQARGLFILKLLSNKRVQSLLSIRKEETDLFMKKCGKSLVNLSKMFSEFTNDVISRSAFGRKYSESKDGQKFLQLMVELSEVAGDVGIGEFIPWLGWIDRVTGFNERVNQVTKEVDDFLDGVIEESLGIKKEQALEDKNGENFVDIMLQVCNDNTADDVSIDRDSIKAIILDVFSAGTENSAVVLEWAMTELLAQPTLMEKLQREVRQIVQHKHDIADDDLEKMHYLKAVIKETLRLHPPLPLLLPRVARRDVIINGYNISMGTMVMVNAWAIGRDSASWDEPEKFKPERFLNTSIDFKGLDFELIPFGAGRRGCPAITYSLAMIEILLANLLQKFNWKLPNGADGKDLDMSEKPGITTHKAIPVLAVAMKTSLQ